jgi:hypothetical protein
MQRRSRRIVWWIGTLEYANHHSLTIATADDDDGFHFYTSAVWGWRLVVPVCQGRPDGLAQTGGMTKQCILRILLLCDACDEFRFPITTPLHLPSSDRSPSCNRRRKDGGHTTAQQLGCRVRDSTAAIWRMSKTRSKKPDTAACRCCRGSGIDHRRNYCRASGSVGTVQTRLLSGS